jgi:DNA-nicking Smr family endonuclease
MTKRSASSGGAAPDRGDDAELFRDAVGPVRKLEHGYAEPQPRRPRPHPAQTLADEAGAMRALLERPVAELDLELNEPLAYVAPGVAARVLKRLGRGEYAVRDELDLHHMTAAVAGAAMREFLDRSRELGRLCVKIIHGKGLRSKGEGPVLKRLTDRLLRQRSDVIAFRSARAVDGGSGAVIVLLRRAA